VLVTDTILTREHTMRNWYCIYTKPQKEELVCRMLEEFPEIELFNPKIKTKKYRRSKLYECIEELFPSYVFTRFQAGRFFHTIQYTRGVRGLVGKSTGEPSIVEEAIIENIRSRMKDGFVCLECTTFEHGDKVMINQGPLAGFTGIFLQELKASERVLILLTAMGVRVDLGNSHVEKVVRV
jgi:transcription antitermination factor NusG